MPRYLIDLEWWSLLKLTLRFIGLYVFFVYCLNISNSIFITFSDILTAFLTNQQEFSYQG